MEIPELVTDSIGGDGGDSGAGGIGANGGGGTEAGTGGVDPGGSGGSDVLPPPCPIGQKQCNDGQCRPVSTEFGCGSPICTPCPEVARAVVGCTEGLDSQCFVQHCETGFADCNGDVISARGDALRAGNGCEFQFAPVSPTPQTLPVPFADITLDGQVGDWEALPSYVLDKVCPDCRNDDVTKPITEDGTVPRRNDLEARFRVAWNDDFLFVLGEVFDPDVLDDGTRVSGCEDIALCEDGLQVFVDGQQQTRQGYFNDGIRVLFGAGDSITAPAQGDRHVPFVDVKTGRQFGPACYSMEARLDWRYLTNQISGAPLPAGVFPPANGQNYAFNVSVSDWDPTLADENVFERQSHVFGLPPGDDYALDTNSLPLMVLEGRAADPQ